MYNNPDHKITQLNEKKEKKFHFDKKKKKKKNSTNAQSSFEILSCH